MKILFVPNLIVSSLSDKDRANILEAAGPGSRLVEVKDSASQRRELPDTYIIFGRVHSDNANQGNIQLFSASAYFEYDGGDDKQFIF